MRWGERGGREALSPNTHHARRQGLRVWSVYLLRDTELETHHMHCQDSLHSQQFNIDPLLSIADQKSELGFSKPKLCFTTEHQPRRMLNRARPAIPLVLKITIRFLMLYELCFLGTFVRTIGLTLGGP